MNYFVPWNRKNTKNTFFLEKKALLWITFVSQIDLRDLYTHSPEFCIQPVPQSCAL